MVSYRGDVGTSGMARQALVGNVLFSGVSGALLLLGAGAVDSFLGLGSPLALRLIGVGLLGWAAWMARATRQPTLDPMVLRIVLAGDIGWLLLTALVLASGWPPLSSAGRWTLLGLADIVVLFVLWQYLALRRM